MGYYIVGVFSKLRPVPNLPSERAPSKLLELIIVNFECAYFCIIIFYCRSVPTESSAGGGVQ